TGVVANSSSDTIHYTSTIYYYDSNYNLVAQGYNSGTAISGTSNFDQISNLSILGGHSISEIYYYRLSIHTTDNTNSSGTMNSTVLTPSKNYQYSSYDYVIDKYDVNIVVNENNTFDITETITAYFNVSKHGIFRTIPLKNTITRLDGTTSTNRTQVTNISVDNEYTTSRENGNYKLQIGSASRTLTGEQKYIIKYTYNLGKDPIKDYDELYYNIIGNEWDTVIGNVTFSIKMPKEFDSSKLGFSSGITGSTENSKVKYNVSENTITGSYDDILAVGEALTIRCELPEGYFVGAGLNINIMDYILFLIPIIFLAIAILLWHKFGRDDQVVETVEFYPPQGFNSLEVGFLYKGQADNRDVTSLLIYLANKGYIRIAETEEKSLFSKYKGFKVTKLKEYDGNNINERIFLNGLFTRRPSYTSLFSKTSETPTDSINEVTSTDLYDNFYITMHKILSNINNKENKNKLFEKSASGKIIFILLMIIATYCLITIPPVLTYGKANMLMVALLFPGFGFILGFTLMFSLLFGGAQTIYVNGKATHSSIGIKLLGLIGLVWGGMFGGIPWALTVLPALLQDPMYLIGYIISMGCMFGMIICLIYLPKRTSYGNEMLGKLRGFKKFLETAEKEKLEAMVMQNPTYFYNILPYTYVLGVSDKWIKNFESISLQAPSWYDSPNVFDMVAFGSFINSAMESAESVMSSSPSSSSGGSSSGGGSSGGGSSGGGSGGGGGGSW
ncbi:MAG: DUF2207 domain-containing protein, partial [bacterium]|nr:DUF2207 domain-containing protein [bacterium]